MSHTEADLSHTGLSREVAQPLDVETAVRARYSGAAQVREAALCCPVDYDRKHLEIIPPEVIERDYGCGDPSRYVRQGDAVLDLGSGSGKICFIAAQLTGAEGAVIGVDMNEEMLAVARSAAPRVAEAVGYANTRFLRGRIQDLALDVEAVEAWLAAHPVRDATGLEALEAELRRQRSEAPLVPDASIDIAISNCVLNLVRDEDKKQLLRELYRVVRRGGRIAISDIVADEAIPAALKADPELWSGCVSGAFLEGEFLRELEEVGFHGARIERWEEEPFHTVDGIEFRSVTVTAHKGKEGPCYEANQAVIYRGPWRSVEDDDGHVLRRGERVAVCAKTFDILTSEPYAEQILPIEPRVAIPAEERRPFDCSRTAPRHPRESKGSDYRKTGGGGGGGAGGSRETCC